MVLAYGALTLVGVAMVGFGVALVIGFLRRSRCDAERPPDQRRAEVGATWTQRAVLGALLVTSGFFLAVLGALLTYASRGP